MSKNLMSKYLMSKNLMSKNLMSKYLMSKYLMSKILMSYKIDSLVSLIACKIIAPAFLISSSVIVKGGERRKLYG